MVHTLFLTDSRNFNPMKYATYTVYTIVLLNNNNCFNISINELSFSFSVADRSFNDIMQYPVLPWILADYTSSTLGRECGL